MALEPEFEQARAELLSILENSTLFQKNPDYRKALKIILEPENTYQFRVVWVDDQGIQQVNRGYRIHYNTALGTCKGGLGGAKGGADFDPKGKSPDEIRRFCQAFMCGLKDHIGTQIDIPGGDIGCSTREIGWLFGEHQKLTKSSEGVVTGKGLAWGRSLGRTEAAGFGVVYYVDQMIKHRSHDQESIRGKRVAISGSGNVATYAAMKTIPDMQAGNSYCLLRVGC